MGIEIGAVIAIIVTLHKLIKYKYTSENQQTVLKETFEAVTRTTENVSKEITEKLTNEFASEIENYSNIINIERKKYQQLEEKYIPLLQQNEILRSKQIKDKDLASEVFGDDND